MSPTELYSSINTSNGSSTSGDRLTTIKTRGKYVNQACEQCRISKARCQLDETSRERKCRRCVASDRDCFFTSSTRRKPRKRTDKRVLELEQKLEAVQSLIENPRLPKSPSVDRNHASHLLSRRNPTPSFDNSPSSLRPAGDSPNENLENDVNSAAIRSLDDSGFRGNPDLIESRTEFVENLEVSATPNIQDVIDRGLISDETAEMLFDRYVNYLAPQYPIVVFHDNVTSNEIRRSRPTLFLAILAAASGTHKPCLFRDLNTELLRVFAEKVVMSSEKSLELVQAMLIMAVWYFPPDRFEELKHYQYIHMVSFGEPPTFLEAV